MGLYGFPGPDGRKLLYIFVWITFRSLIYSSKRYLSSQIS